MVWDDPNTEVYRYKRHPGGAERQDVARRRQEGLDVENAACCGVKTESHHGAREAVLVTITDGHNLFETYLKENIYYYW